jgi:CBS domain-containing protein
LPWLSAITVAALPPLRRIWTLLFGSASPNSVGRLLLVIPSEALKPVSGLTPRMTGLAGAVVSMTTVSGLASALTLPRTSMASAVKTYVPAASLAGVIEGPLLVAGDDRTQERPAARRAELEDLDGVAAGRLTRDRQVLSAGDGVVGAHPGVGGDTHEVRDVVHVVVVVGVAVRDDAAAEDGPVGGLRVRRGGDGGDGGSARRQTRVGEVMTAEVICCSPETSTDEARGAMRDRRIRHLPVADGEGKLLGLVSIGDLNAELQAEQEQTLFFLQEYIGGRT